MAEQIYLFSKQDLDQFKKEVLNSIEAHHKEDKHSQLNYMRSKEVMKELAISSSHLQKMRIKGLIPHTKIGDTFFYPRAEIKALLDANKAQSLNSQGSSVNKKLPNNNINLKF